MLAIVGFVGEAFCFVAGISTAVVASREFGEERGSLYTFAFLWAVGWATFLSMMLFALFRLLRIVSRQAPGADDYE